MTALKKAPFELGVRHHHCLFKPLGLVNVFHSLIEKLRQSSLFLTALQLLISSNVFFYTTNHIFLVYIYSELVVVGSPPEG